MSPDLGLLPHAPRSRPVNPGATAPGLEKGTTASEKADRRTESDRTGRHAPHYGHGLEMKKVPLVIHLVKQESHRAGVGNREADGAAQAVDKEQEPEWRVPERKGHLHLVHIPPRVGEEEKARWVVEEDRGKQELRVYPQPVHMLAQVRGGPEVVELNEYLEGKVGQRVHYPDVLRPELLPKRLATRRLQAIMGQVPVRETIMRWYRHKGMDFPEEYMRCHCGQGQETYEHFLRCEQYKGIKEPLVRDQDVPLLKKGARG